MNRKAVFLDLDDTILDFHRSEAFALSKTLSTVGVDPTPERISLYSAVNDAQWKLLEKGELTRDEVLTRRFKIFFEQIGLSLPALQIRHIYEKNLSESAFFLPGAPTLLDSLSKDFRLFAVSNGTAAVQDGRISLSGIGKYFEKIFISERIGFNKPDPRFFDFCFSEIKELSRADTVLIGDSLTSDILGGKNAGIVTLWFNPKGLPCGETVPDFTASSLEEIPEILKRIWEDVPS